MADFVKNVEFDDGNGYPTPSSNDNDDGIGSSDCDGENFVGCVRARGLPARQSARQPAARTRWLLNARSVAKTDTRIVFLVEFWV